MKLGFVGVGSWAQKLASAFRECGADVVAYCRDDAEKPADGFGRFAEYWDQIADASIDAIVACGPPDVTTEIALACAKAGKRCVATKPLLWTEAPECLPRGIDLHMSGAPATEWPASRIYVDLWRLYSPAWLAMKEELRGKRIERIDVAFCGNGPFRSFNGALDYGPHALAFVFDLLGTDLEYSGAERHRSVTGDLYSAELKRGNISAVARIGNGASVPERSVTVFCSNKRYTWSEPEGGRESLSDGRLRELLVSEKAVALRRFCRAFMAGESSRTLEYSIAAQRVLERIVDGKE